MVKIGSLCTGYGGLDHAVLNVLGGLVTWTSDIDKGACKIIAHRYPDVPNIGDMTTVDWSSLEPIDVLTAGYPCQPFSHAGRRKGTNDERHLWPHVREAVRVLRPRLTVLENVAGHRSLGFDRVLGDLAEDGMHVWWTSLRASDVGAAHRRERLFIFVTPNAGCEPGEVPDSRRLTAVPRTGGDGATRRVLLPNPRTSDSNGPGHHGAGGVDLRTAVSLLPTPKASNFDGSTSDGFTPNLRERVSLLPTPAVNDMGDRPWAREPGAWDAWIERQKAEHGNGNGHGRSLAVEAAFGQWGDYAPAIARWEHVLGRPAPAPTQTSSKGNPQLSAAFVEWLMGLSAGWVTDVPGITRNEALKALGNGVVPQQAEAAIRWLLARIEVAA